MLLDCPSLTDPMRWVLGTLIASARHSRLCPLELFGEGQPRLAQEEVKALAGLWRAQLEFNDRYNTHLALYLEPSGRVLPMDNALPYNLDEDSVTWSWWCADRAVVAGAEGDNELSLSLQLGHLKFEGRGERIDFRCSTFVGEVVYEGADNDPVGTFSMQLSLPMKTSVADLEERYRERIASRPPPPPAFAFDEFVGWWFMGLTEYEAPGTVFFPAEFEDDGTWRSVRTMPILTGAWGVCDGAPDSHGLGPDVQPTGSNVWLTLDSATSGEVHLQGKPVLKDASREQEEGQEETQEEAATPLDNAGAGGGTEASTGSTTSPVADRAVADRADGHGHAHAHAHAHEHAIVHEHARPVADRVYGYMWLGGLGQDVDGRDYFGEFRLLRENARQTKEVPAKKQAQAKKQAKPKEEVQPTSQALPKKRARAMKGIQPKSQAQAKKQAQSRNQLPMRGKEAEEEVEGGMVLDKEVEGGLVLEDKVEGVMVPERGHMVGKLSEEEAKRVWLAQRGLDVPLWGPGGKTWC